jgi:hypothetical protein
MPERSILSMNELKWMPHSHRLSEFANVRSEAVMSTITGPTFSRNTTIARTEGGSEVKTILLLLCLGLLGIAIGLTLAIFFPMSAEVTTLL